MRAPTASVTGWLLFRAELVLMKARVSLFCFGRKYFKPRFIENVERDFLWLESGPLL